MKHTLQKLTLLSAAVVLASLVSPVYLSSEVVARVASQEEGTSVGQSEITNITDENDLGEIPIVAPNITCEDVSAMLLARGTKGEQLDAAMEVIFKESGCNPNAVNAQSGAFGLCQALPAEKMATAGEDYRTNPETQLAWCDSYAKRRYRGWIGAAIQQRRFGWF